MGLPAYKQDVPHVVTAETNALDRPYAGPNPDLVAKRIFWAVAGYCVLFALVTFVMIYA